MFLCCKDADLSADIKQNMNLLNNLQLSIENIVLNSWNALQALLVHEETALVRKKHRRCLVRIGVTTSVVISQKKRTEPSADAKAKNTCLHVFGVHAVTPSTTYGCIGSSYLSTLLYAQYMAELKRCQDTGELFNPSFKENIPKHSHAHTWESSKQKFFGFKYSRLAKYIPPV